MSEEKVCYTEVELSEFKELIEKKIESAKQDLSLLQKKLF